jgi:predicted Zn finger-like uncharacterized protein
MRIVCPNCSATYEVPEAILAGTPRMVRCARCGTEWLPEAAAEPAPLIPEPPSPSDDSPPIPMPSPPPEPKPGARREPKLSSYRPRSGVIEDDERLPPRDYESLPSRRGALIGWVLSGVLLAAIGWSAVSFRSQVMAAWPPSERVYGALGLR